MFNTIRVWRCGRHLKLQTWCLGVCGYVSARAGRAGAPFCKQLPAETTSHFSHPTTAQWLHTDMLTFMQCLVIKSPQLSPDKVSNQCQVLHLTRPHGHNHSWTSCYATIPDANSKRRTVRQNCCESQLMWCAVAGSAG